MPSMTQEKLAEYLERPLVASFCTVAPDGSPNVTPVWFVYAEGKFFCWIDTGSVKAHNIVRNQKVALCIATHDEPYRYVAVEGVARTVRDGIEPRAQAISVRYYGEERGQAYAEALSFQDSLIVEVTPSKIRTRAPRRAGRSAIEPTVFSGGLQAQTMPGALPGLVSSDEARVPLGVIATRFPWTSGSRTSRWRVWGIAQRGPSDGDNGMTGTAQSPNLGSFLLAPGFRIAVASVA